MIELHDAAVLSPDGETTILRPTSLRLTEPHISVVGGNGSGKSTLARLLNGLIAPTSGTVTVTPHPNTKPLDTVRDGARVRRNVGFVFTDPSAQLIMPTVLEDVSLSLRRTHRDKLTRREAALDVLTHYGLDALAERSVHTLSGGQKQLLAIASVLATKPAVLVADEPTTLLDLRNSRLVGDLLMSLPQQLIVITHDLALAERADRTLVVEAGRVIFDGAPTEAIAHYRERAEQARQTEHPEHP